MHASRQEAKPRACNKGKAARAFFLPRKLKREEEGRRRRVKFLKFLTLPTHSSPNEWRFIMFELSPLSNIIEGVEITLPSKHINS